MNNIPPETFYLYRNKIVENVDWLYYYTLFFFNTMSTLNERGFTLSHLAQVWDTIKFLSTAGSIPLHYNMISNGIEMA